MSRIMQTLRRRWQGLGHSLLPMVRGASPPRRPQDTALLRALLQGDEHTTSVLLQRGANPNLTLPSGLPILLLAAREGWLSLVKTLLEAGADVEAVYPKTKHTALMIAAMYGHVSLVALLLQAGAEPYRKSQEGRTAVMWAKDRGHEEVVALFISQGIYDPRTSLLLRPVESEREGE